MVLLGIVYLCIIKNIIIGFIESVFGFIQIGFLELRFYKVNSKSGCFIAQFKENVIYTHI
ncbi:hypothetical protein Hanom_Chr15g01412051 [Helianthus anomalus]